jgi:hypothetical protein
MLVPFVRGIASLGGVIQYFLRAVDQPRSLKTTKKGSASGAPLFAVK